MKHILIIGIMIYSHELVPIKKNQYKHTSTYKKEIIISQNLAKEIGFKIWDNECKRSIHGLTSWNEGENFASLGIGHFIWYPESTKQLYNQSFPDLLLFMQKKGKSLPKGILKKDSTACPWSTREEFNKNINSPAMNKLRTFLANSIDLQVQFIIDRFKSSLATILKVIPLKNQSEIEEKFYLIAHEPNGLYALIDYINFKGLGINPQEEYQGNRWGLLQVLENMNSNTKKPLDEFVKSAKQVLADRVSAAASGKNEERWLPGWYKRLDTYAEL